MTKIGGYVNMYISNQYVPCLACGEDIKIESIDNLTEIDPQCYGIVLNAEQCECGFKTILEYDCNWDYSHRLSVEQSGQGRWLAQRGYWSVIKIEEGEEE